MDLVERFEATYGFPFDDFQKGACRALVGGASVLVAAPTGAGKTVVGEFAAWFALQEGGKTFYTTPIKALSNQKYGDFMGLYGPEQVGLLTGDNSLNGEAPVVVMTTEVLRNMIYEDSPTLRGLRYVVLDEVHYLQDRYRGGVWEEILIHLPVDVQIVSLSATVSNAEEFAEWLQTLRGRTEVIIEEKRPVEVRHWYFASDQLLPMFVQKSNGDVVPNPRAADYDQRRRRSSAGRPGRGGKRPRPPHARIPYRTDVVDRLNSEGMLPAIYFIFSRRGCDEAVKRCLNENIRLTTPDERRRITEYADLRASELPEEELDILGYHDWIAGLANGIAAHHAGMIPPFKETVEELFKKGLVKVVFATETLALGIDMPRAHRRDREPDQVHRGEARIDDPRRVHAALRESWPQGQGRARAFGGPPPEVHAVRHDRPPRIGAHVSAEVVVPTLVQHGGQSRPELRQIRGRASRELVVRPVPSRS